MTDAEIEAGFRDELADQVAADIGSEYGDDATVREVVAVVLMRLRGAGVADRDLAAMLLDRPQKLRAYYGELERLRVAHSVETDPAKQRELRLQITSLTLSHNSRLGK